jgi:Zn-dependent M28 family amino/carboxypeptidase
VYRRIALIPVAVLGILLGCTAKTPEPQSQHAAPAATAAEVTETDAAADAAVQISDPYIRKIIAEISGDAYEGRGPASPGDLKTRKYLAGRMAELGLEPGAADGGWEQQFELVGLNTHQPKEWTFESKDGSATFRQWDQYLVNSGVETSHTAVSDAEVVFVGYGIQAPEFGWDDFKGADLKGKVLLIMNNDPDWDPELFAGETRLWYGRWDYKYQIAAKQGAAGAIIIHTAPSAGYPFQVLQTSNTGIQFELPAGDEAHTRFKAWMTEAAAKRLVALAGMDLDALREKAYNRDFRPVPLGVKTSIAMDVDVTRVRTANVLGLIPGSDPSLKDEVVIYSAHHDHLGIGPPDADGDTIYNGALDNATGVATVMGIARGFKALPTSPRRSILIALVGAEEQGLLGSQWYARDPTFPPGKIAADINFDGGNIWGKTHDVTFIGLGKSSIDGIALGVAAQQGREVKPDQFASRGYFYRSDQFSFARIGVPAMYLDPGTDFVDRPPGWGKEQVDHYTEVNYHQPSDEYDPSWNMDGLLDDARMAFWVGLSIANADAMPTWNPGDEFEAARKKALTAAGN